MKIKLRQYRISDLERLCKIFIDDAVIKNLAVPLKAKDISREDEEEWIKKNIKAYKEKSPEEYNLAITLDGNYIGSIGIHHVNYKKKNTQIGYWIGKDYWGKGITSQVIKKFVNHITMRFGFKEVIATPFSNNEPSQKVLEKAGFDYKRTKKKAFKKHSKWLDEKIYVRKLK